MEMTQTELGRRTGILNSMIWKIENDAYKCSEQDAKAIATVLRCKVDTLFKPVTKRKTRYVVRRSGR